MVESANPYAAPRPLDAETCRAAGDSAGFQPRLMAAWAAVVFANVLIPLVLTLASTGEAGKLGMIVAMAVVLVCGWWFCYAFPVLGRKLVAGSVLMALSQLFPIMQMIAGLAGMGIAYEFGFYIEGNDDVPDVFTSEFGGFLATMITGTVLLVASFIAGWIVAFILPKRWFCSSSIDDKSSGHPYSTST